MGRNDFKEGWAVVDDQGLNVRSVSETRRAAIINWLVTEAGRFISTSHSDEQIDAMWDAERGDAMARRIRIYAQ